MAGLRHRQPQSVEILLQERYLPAEGQEEVIQQLQQQYVQQKRLWAAVFAAFAALLGSGFLSLALHQIAYPWALRHHAYFYHTVSAQGVAGGELLCATCLFLSSAVLSMHFCGQKVQASHNWQIYLFYSNAASAFAAVLFWIPCSINAAAFQEDAILHLWHYAWLPLGPSAYMLLSWHLIRTFDQTGKDISALRGAMYNLHSA